MTTRIAALICMLFIQPGLSGKDKPLCPIGFPPTVGVGKAIVSDGKVLIELTVASWVHVTDESMVERDGKKVREIRKGYKQAMAKGCFFVHEKDAVTLAKDGKTIESFMATPLQGVAIFTKNGKAVARNDLPKLFEKARPVLVFGGKKLDPYYLQVIRDDVLVITGAGNYVFPPTEETLEGK